MNLEVRERDFESFFQAPFEAYGETPYVSLLKQDLRRFLDFKQNPLFTKFGSGTYFSVLANGRPVGRVLAHIHRKSNEKFQLRRGYFGFLDGLDDPAVFGRLLKSVEDWNRAQGMTEVAGNFNMTAMQQIGVMTEGFGHVPYTDQLYTPEHIQKHLTAQGYEPFFPNQTFELDLGEVDETLLIKDKHRKVMESGEFQFEKLSLFNTESCLRAIMDTLNDGFQDNPMFVPLTWEEFYFQAKDMMWIMDRRISVILKKDGMPVGSIVCIPDLNPMLKAMKSRLGWTAPIHFLRHRMNRKRAVIIFYSVKKKFHGRGLNAIMLHRILGRLKEAGYEKLGLTWIADVNAASLAQVQKLGAKPHHRLCLFRKEL